MNSKYMKAILEGNAEELSRLRRKCGLDATPANILQDEELRTNIPQSLLTHPTSFCKTYKHHGLVRHSSSDVLQSTFSHHKGSFKRSLVYNTGSRRTTPLSLEDENVEIPSKYVMLAADALYNVGFLSAKTMADANAMGDVFRCC